jgi:hypothetical protein
MSDSLISKDGMLSSRTHLKDPLQPPTPAALVRFMIRTHMKIGGRGNVWSAARDDASKIDISVPFWISLDARVYHLEDASMVHMRPTHY